MAADRDVVIITGSSGFIGSALVQRLADRYALVGFLAAGDDVIIVPTVTDEQAKRKFPDGWKAPKPYLRIVPQPR